MGCFPILLGGSLEVPASIYLCSVSDFGWLGISSTRPSCCCIDPALCGCLHVEYFVFTVVAPFPPWDPSTLTVLCGFPTSLVCHPCLLSYGSMSMKTVVGAHVSSSISFRLTRSTCGEGISLTSMNSPYVWFLARPHWFLKAL
jgi:hypothetical protein